MVPSGFADLHHELYWWLRDRSTETEMRDTVRRLAAFYQVDVRRSVSISIGHAPPADRYDCCVQSPLQARATARHLRSMCRPASRIAGAPIATAKEHADEQTEPNLDFGLEPRE